MSTFRVLFCLALLGLTGSFVAGQAGMAPAPPAGTMPLAPPAGTMPLAPPAGTVAPVPSTEPDNTTVSTNTSTTASSFSCRMASCTAVSVGILTNPTCKGTMQTCNGSTTCISIVQYTGIKSVGKASITLGCATTAQLSECHSEDNKEQCNSATTNQKCVTCCKTANCNNKYDSPAASVVASLPLLAAAIISSMML
eukprot:scpid92462/ scgid32481/ 